MRAFTRVTLDWEPQLRTSLRLSLEPGAEQPVLRQGRAIGWIEDALAPLRTTHPAVDAHRLAVAIRAATGIEALVWLTDIAGLSRAYNIGIRETRGEVLAFTDDDCVAPPDWIAAIKRGDNYGFPFCPKNPRTCSTYSQPLVTLPAHSSPMGLAYLDGKVYIALYVGLGKGPVVASMPPKGGTLTPLVSGFPAGVIALGAVGRYLYAGEWEMYGNA